MSLSAPQVRRPVQQLNENFFPRGRIMTVLAILAFLFASPPEFLLGTVLDPTGAAVAAAKVELSGSAISRITYTDAAGMFSIPDAPAGTYSLRVTANGFTTHTSRVEVPSDPLAL